MGSHALAHLHVNARRDVVLRRLGPRSRIGDLSLELPAAAVRRVRWVADTEALRRTGRWTRGGREGPAAVDLVVAGAARTLMSVQLEPSRGWLAAVPTGEEARAVARHLRAVIEADRAAVGAAGPAAPTPVGTPVESPPVRVEAAGLAVRGVLWGY